MIPWENPRSSIKSESDLIFAPPIWLCAGCRVRHGMPHSKVRCLKTYHPGDVWKEGWNAGVSSMIVRQAANDMSRDVAFSPATACVLDDESVVVDICGLFLAQP